ncbi:hypothetical protein ED733_001633 [Metarhizium rileyi]|uniref:Uncharacterized protein n=1 Tax=Metarhizium rileyi (strain RCEF 4871) TaxID=1649241 RepID=A0A5C6G1I8_METRR|nr:hypothetical protein ED733_001633 [Metarhizium rileyi]
MDDPFRDYNRNTLSLRLEAEDRIRSKLRGFYFATGDTILGSKHDDNALLQELYPDHARDTTASDVTDYIFRVLLACSEKWHILIDVGPLSFWKAVTTLGEMKSNIRIRPLNTRNLITSLIKARHRYVLRQTAIYPDFNIEDDMRPGNDAAAQTVLERVLALNDVIRFSGDVFRSPICSEAEKRDLLKHAIKYGPVRQISSKRFQLAPGAPQNLHPISDLSRGPATLNARGFVEKLVVSLKSPTKSIEDITAPKTIPSKRTSTPSRRHGSDLSHTASNGKPRSEKQ